MLNILFASAFCMGNQAPGSTGSLVELHDLLPLLEEPEEGRDAANVEDVGADTHDVVQDAGQLSEQHPDNHNSIIVYALDNPRLNINTDTQYLMYLARSGTSILRSFSTARL